jgi:hypothetical protein
MSATHAVYTFHVARDLLYIVRLYCDTHVDRQRACHVQASVCSPANGLGSNKFDGLGFVVDLLIGLDANGPTLLTEWFDLGLTS